MNLPFEYDQVTVGEFGGTTPTTTDFESARVVILPIPLDRTTSYVPGALNGPHEILVASSHMELWDEETQTDVHSIGICTLPEMEFPFGTMDEVVAEIRRVTSELVSRDKFVVALGGGTPKNFINQACVQAEFYSDEVGGHKYALQIVTDVPYFGGASGSTLEEAESWGKLAADAARVLVQADATIALPLLASALAATAPPLLARRKMPTFTLASRVMTVDGETVPSDHFEDMHEPAV